MALARSIRRTALGGFTMLLVAAFVAVQARPAAALAYTVTRFDDPSPDGCPAGDCSLREAVIAANTSGVPDTITIPPGTYTLTRSGSDNTASAGDLDITGPVTITGGGAGSTTIDGNGVVTDDRVFHIVSSTANPTAISGVTVGGGQSVDNGGGIMVFDGSLTLTDVVVTDNQSPSAGGGISVNDGTLVLTSSTLSNNQAVVEGGGIAAYGSTASIVNSTLSGNSANGNGGGVLASGSTATVTLTNATVTDNTADSNNLLTFPPEESGGGIRTRSSATITMRNTIVSGNEVGTAGVNPDCAATVNSQGHNLVRITTGCTGLGGPGDLTGTDALLGPLATQGGPTPTHAPLPGSPAIDHGSPTEPGLGGDACATTDQRGVARPQLTRCDVGAHEVQASELPSCFGKAPTAVGTDGPDGIKASSKADVILGFGDKDVVNASGGNDRVCGGEGNDKLKGAAGKDKLKGDQGKDTCIGGSGKDKAVKCERLKTIP